MKSLIRGPNVALQLVSIRAVRARVNLVLLHAFTLVVFVLARCDFLHRWPWRPFATVSPYIIFFGSSFVERPRRTKNRLFSYFSYIYGRNSWAGAAGRHFIVVRFNAVRRALQIHKSCVARARAHTANSTLKCIETRVFFSSHIFM